MIKELSAAVEADLGRGEITTWCTEFSVIDLEFKCYFKNLEKWMQEENIDTPMILVPGKSSIVYEPMGLVLIMGSWNFPLCTTLIPLINAIGAGNSAIVKPSELAPHTSIAVAKLVSCYLDPSFFRVI